MTTFDLDAARAARRAKLDRNPTVTLDGEEWELVPEVPMHVLEQVEQGRASAIRRLVVADADKFPVDELTVQDVKDLLKAVYGLGPTT